MMIICSVFDRMIHEMPLLSISSWTRNKRIARGKSCLNFCLRIYLRIYLRIHHIDRLVLEKRKRTVKKFYWKKESKKKWLEKLLTQLRHVFLVLFPVFNLLLCLLLRRRRRKWRLAMMMAIDEGSCTYKTGRNKEENKVFGEGCEPNWWWGGRKYKDSTTQNNTGKGRERPGGKSDPWRSVPSSRSKEAYSLTVTRLSFFFFWFSFLVNEETWKERAAKCTDIIRPYFLMLPKKVKFSRRREMLMFMKKICVDPFPSSLFFFLDKSIESS